MFRAIRWTLGGLGLALLLGGGASIFWRPAREVLYALERSPITCHSAGCIALYRVEVGNTGRELQPEVRVRLHAGIVSTAVLPPRARDFGKIDRPVRVEEDGGVRTFALGALQPEERVDLAFALQRPEPAAFPAWEEILVAVEAPDASVARGSPAWTMLLRVWYSLVRVF